jgi:hypothetical protein
MRFCGPCPFCCRFEDCAWAWAGANLPDSTLRMGLKGSTIGNQWYVSGGSNLLRTPSSAIYGADMITYKYTITTNAWTTSALSQTPNPTCRAHCRAHCRADRQPVLWVWPGDSKVRRAVRCVYV